MSDQVIQKLESQFPAVSGAAFPAARERVLQPEDGAIYEVLPDRRKGLLKRIAPTYANGGRSSAKTEASRHKSAGSWSMRRSWCKGV